MLSLLSLVYHHFVSMVGWYASCLDFNLSSDCRLNKQGSLLMMKRQYTRSTYHDNVRSNLVVDNIPGVSIIL